MFQVMGGALSDVEWTLVSVTGREAVSELFSFTLVVLARQEDLPEHAEDSLLQQDVVFRLGSSGVHRAGMVASARFDGIVDDGGRRGARFRLHVVPRAWLLHQRRNSRIFQNQHVHEIVSEVLSENGVRHRWSLGNHYPKRVYCTQYQETDHEFVTRLLAEEGIFFYFVFPDDHLEDPEAEEEERLSDAEQVRQGIMTGAAITKGIAGAAGGMLGGLGDTAKGIAGVVGSGADIIGDAAAGFAHEEHEHPIVPGEGHVDGLGGHDVFVFVDRAGAYASSRGPDGETLALQLRGEAGLVGDEDQIAELSPRRAVRPRHVEVRDYDFQRPLLLLNAKADHDATAAPGGHDLDPHGGGASHGSDEGFEQRPLEMYWHHGDFERPDVDGEMAGVHLEQHRADAVLSVGRGFSPRMLAGHVFTVESDDHDVPIGSGSFAVTQLHHAYFNPTFAATGDRATEAIVAGCTRAIQEAVTRGGAVPEEDLRELIREATRQDALDIPYQNRFRCVPSDVPFRPPRPARVMRNVTESATVVGPVGKEIHLDSYGRVKIQFHWDRQHAYKGDSSCWIRVAQTWGGTGYGFQFFPRVGMEVLVTFIGGDPDRPVVIGSLYNGTHPTPEPLPLHPTRSSLRTQTSPGGGGFNELAFEDKKGHERIYVHAERNLDFEVNQDRNVTVSRNDLANVTGEQQVGVGKSRLLAIGENQTTLVGENRAEYVRGSRTDRVVQNQSSRVDGNAVSEVGGVCVQSVQTDALTLVEGNRDLTVYGDCLTHVGGREADKTSNAVTYVQGSHFLTATERVVTRAQDAEGDAERSEIRFECGDSIIEIKHDRIVMRSPKIELWTEEHAHIQVGLRTAIQLKDKVINVGADEQIFMATNARASLLLKEDLAQLRGPKAKVRGASISFSGELDPPADAEGLSPDPEPDMVGLKLCFTHQHEDEGGEKIADTKFRVVAGDCVREGTTTGDGEVDVQIPREAEVVQVILWANEQYPDLYRKEGGPLRWLLHMMDEKPEASDVRGARFRLRNLGYDPGGKVVDSEPDAPEEEHGDDDHGDSEGHGDSDGHGEGGAGGGHGEAPPKIDGATRQALLEYQIDHALGSTGALDDATKESLEEVYGS